MNNNGIQDRLPLPRVIVGCMRLASGGIENATRLVSQAVENGLNFFDHADIYGGGESEKTFAKAIKNAKISRDKVVLQSKCGIVPGVMYDFSKEHIVRSVEGILSRLDTDRLDVLLLHRPDALMQPEEVGEAFTSLYESGKVGTFGVSNMNPMQMQLLQSGLKNKIEFDQIQFSPVHAGAVSSGFEVNMETVGAADRSGGVIEYCRLKGITLQAWSPFQYGFIKGAYIGNPSFVALNTVLDEVGKKYGLSASATVAAWIARHPAGIQTVCGSTNADRLLDVKKGAETVISREDWYRIYTAAGNILP